MGIPGTRRHNPPMHRWYAPLILCLSTVSEVATASPPSHCTSDEFVVLSAWMAPVEPTSAGWRSTQRGKVLSLCADKLTEPFSKLSYRYGAPARVELEVAASPRSPFLLASRSTSPHTGNDIVFFRQGAYTYYIAIATAQGSGVSLHVFNGSREVARHFSGNLANTDFQLGPAELDFNASRPRSSVLARAEAPHSF